jgi:hypothetical protein
MKRLRMLHTLKLMGTFTVFHKGITYDAIPATNQPLWRERELYFVQKRNRESMLVSLVDGDANLV